MDLDCYIKGHIGFVTLNRPQALHALNLAMINSLTEHLLLWQEDPNVHAVIIQAPPGKAFCAGGDVRSIYDMRGDLRHQLQFFEQEYRLNQLVHDYPKPYIALMNGITMGGGVGISLHGSHPIASEAFVCAMPETSIGFFPDIGASHILSHCPGYWGQYLGLTGDRLGPADALALNLVKAVVAAEDFPNLINDLLESDLSNHAVESVNACVAVYAQQPHPESFDIRQHAIDACFHAESVELIIEALSQRGDDWSASVRVNLLRKSPLSLKVSLQQLSLAKGLKLSECLSMDKRLLTHFLQDHDFYEGVRSVIVDKDHTPHWQPAGLSEVSSGQVERYFQ